MKDEGTIYFNLFIRFLIYNLELSGIYCSDMGYTVVSYAARGNRKLFSKKLEIQNLLTRKEVETKNRYTVK
jgi:hypothetical protein